LTEINIPSARVWIGPGADVFDLANHRRI